MGTHIYLDDLRPLPADYTQLFTTGEDLLHYLEGRTYTHINRLSCDHDLGEDILSGYDVVKEVVTLIEEGKVVVDEFYFHTANVTGFTNMMKYLQGARKHGVIPSHTVISETFVGF